MVKDALEAGYNVEFTTDGCYGSGQVNVHLRPQYMPGDKGYEGLADPDFYPTEYGYGLGDEPFEAMLFAIGDTLLAEKYGWEPV